MTRESCRKPWHYLHPNTGLPIVIKLVCYLLDFCKYNIHTENSSCGNTILLVYSTPHSAHYTLESYYKHQFTSRFQENSCTVRLQLSQSVHWRTRKNNGNDEAYITVNPCYDGLSCSSNKEVHQMNDKYNRNKTREKERKSVCVSPLTYTPPITAIPCIHNATNNNSGKDQ